MFESSHGIRHRLRESKREEGGESEKESETATGFSFLLFFFRGETTKGKSFVSTTIRDKRLVVDHNGDYLGKIRFSMRRDK